MLAIYCWSPTSPFMDSSYFFLRSFICPLLASLSELPLDSLFRVFSSSLSMFYIFSFLISSCYSSSDTDFWREFPDSTLAFNSFLASLRLLCKPDSIGFKLEFHLIIIERNNNSVLFCFVLGGRVIKTKRTNIYSKSSFFCERVRQGLCVCGLLGFQRFEAQLEFSQLTDHF